MAEISTAREIQMTGTTRRSRLDPVLDRALRDAQAAAQRASVVVRELRELDEIERLTALVDRVWDRGGQPIVAAALARAMAHAGNYLAAALAGPDLLGSLIGFLGEENEQVFLHSHVLAVSPETRSKGVGFALKLHQRAWSLQHGHSMVEWTADPLVRKNAYFNLTKLGADLSRYYLNFYGSMNDSLNGTDDSDRILIRWQLDSPRANAAAGLRPDPEAEDIVERGGTCVLAVGVSQEPIARERANPKAPLLIQVPEDIVRLREHDDSLAITWRRALRNALAPAISDGYQTIGMTRSGHYVLKPPPA